MWYAFRGVTIRRSGRCENCVPISPSGTCKVMLLQMLLGRLVKTGSGKVRTNGNGNGNGNGNSLVTLARSAVVACSNSALEVALNSATVLNK